MPKWGYSVRIEELDPETTVKASGREIRVSPKKAREVCKKINKMMLNKAKIYLNDVMTLKRPVPFARHNKKVGHRRGQLTNAFAGRYPVNAAKSILKILEGAEANAEFKGLDNERLRIVHACAYPGVKIKRYMQRAFGKSSAKFKTLCHIEVALKEQRQIGR